ncbi:hypothetical protein ACFPJ1_43065 [Kribbella qitaiheensis]|uniref:hypothetical protein n=1 Tax=Kribbella qitaiheensis TaxID=1544730 RepID=UPI003610E3B3
MPRRYDDYEEAAYSEGIGDIIGGILNPIGAIAGGLGNLFPPAPVPARPPLPPAPPPQPGAGVGTATLTTPQGNAVLRLPSDVVSTMDFQRVTADLQDGINRTTARLNTVDRDTSAANTRITAVAAEIGQASRDVATLRRTQQENTSRLRREISSQQTMSIVMSMMMQKGLSDRVTALEQNAPRLAAGTTQASTTPQANAGSSMMLPMVLMMSQDSADGRDGESSNLPMMMAMMMAFSGGR